MRVIVFSLILSFCHSVSGAVPPSVEGEYSQAVLDLHDKKYKRAMQRISHIEKKESDIIEVLELKAIVLRLLEEYPKSTEAYLHLIKISEAGGAATTKEAAYHFEVGKLLFDQKELGESIPHFEKALKEEKYQGQCHFYLAVIEFEKNHWEESKRHFESVMKSDVAELKAIVSTYMAAISKKQGDTSTYIRNTKANISRLSEEAEQERLSSNTRVLLKELAGTLERELWSLDHSRFIITGGFFGGYDSNPLQDSNGIPSGLGVLQHQFSYASSPMKTWQYLPRLRGSFNLNTNNSTRTTQYLREELSLLLTRHPLQLSNYGFKASLSAAYTYLSETANRMQGSLTPYTLVGGVGAYFKYEFKPKWVLGADLFFQGQKYAEDDSLRDSDRATGWGQMTRFFLIREEIRKYWNPAFSLTFHNNQTSGTEFRSRGLKLEVGNTFYFTKYTILSLAIGGAGVFFPVRDNGSRTDGAWTARLNAGHWLSSDIFLVGNVQLLRNASNIPAYQYHRLVALAGVEYFF